MPEAPHILEPMAQKAAGEVWRAVKGRCAVTVIAFYAARTSGDGTGYVSTLQKPALITTLEVLLARWAGQPSRRDAEAWLPGEKQLIALADMCREALPFAVHSAIVFGAGEDMVCATYASRSDVQKAIESVLLPQLRAEQLVTVQPEAADG